MTGATGGAVMGYAVEGVLVGTIYDAFPWQLVWTPLARHALIAGGLYMGLARAPMRSGRALAVWSGAAVFALLVALYWPSEREALPGRGALALYLVVPMAGVVVAHRALDRLLPPPPRRLVLWAAPALLTVVWVVGSLREPSLLRHALWPCLALVLLALRRRAPGAGWGGGLPLWQAALPLLPPVAVTLLAPPLWACLGAQPTNILVALSTGSVALGLLLRGALCPPQASAASAARRSIAPS